MTLATPALPPEITVFERGWLSSNNVLFTGPDGAALVDSGYCSHAQQTVALVRSALDDAPLGGTPLDAAQTDAIRNWILEGAANN